MTSDTFFIERIYGDSALKHTSRFYLVDFFNDDTALKILLEEGLSKEDAEYVVEMAGGVPWVLEEVLEGENPREVVEDLYRQEVGQLRELLGRVEDRDLRERLIGVLRGLLGEREPDMLGDERFYVEKLVERYAFRVVLMSEPQEKYWNDKLMFGSIRMIIETVLVISAFYDRRLRGKRGRKEKWLV